MKCKLCPNEDTDFTHFSECREKKLMESEGICFGCAFWEIHARNWEKGIEKEKTFFVNHNRYHDGGRVPKGTRGFLGYGGAEFQIKMKDTGEIKTTNNLWHQGDIPEHFWNRMPDNAEFIK